MLNKVCVMGRLVRDPELRRTQSGIAVTTMRIAVDRDYKGPDGAKQADFFDVVAWRNTAEFVSRYFTKGSMMVVDGRLQTREWTDREGNRRINVEIVADNIYFGSSKREGGDYNNGYGAPSGGYGASGGGYGSSAPASGGYGSGASGGYGGGYGASGSGGYGGGYGASGGYGSAPGYGSGGYGGGYGASGGGYGSAPGYGASGGYGGFDNAAPSPSASNAASAPASEDSAASQSDAASPKETAPSGFAEIADDDGDLPF